MPYHAQRLVEVVRHRVGINISGGALLGAQAACKVAEVVNSQRNVRIEGFTDGFAVVPRFGHGQHFEVLLETVGDFEQDVTALLYRGLAPRRSGFMGGIQRFFDIFSARAGNFTEHFAINWANVVEVLALHWGNKLTANVVTIAFLKRNNRARFTWVGVDHGTAPEYYDY